MALSTPTNAGAMSESASTTTHSRPLSEVVSSRRWSMPSSTAAQVRTQPRMIQPRYGNTGDDHGAWRSRRMIRPMLTALNETMANAMVMEAEAWVVLGLPGPKASTHRAVTATANPVTTQRMICGGLTIFVPGLRGGRCITPGSGTSTMNPITTVMTTKNLQKSNWSGNRATPPLMLKIVAYTMSCSTDDKIVNCIFT